MSTTAQTLQSIRSAIAVDHGSGYDLSPEGVVRVGLYEIPPIGQRFVSVYFAGGSASSEAVGVREWAMAQTVHIQCWEPAEGHTPEARETAALGLAEVILGALWGVLVDGSLGVWNASVSMEVDRMALIEDGITSHGVVVLVVGYTIGAADGVV